MTTVWNTCESKPTPHHSCVHTTQSLAVVKRGEYLDVVIATPSSSANFVFVHATKMCGWVPVLCFLWRANQPTRSGMQFRKESVWLRWKVSVGNNEMLSFLGLQTACTIISDSVVFRDVVGGPSDYWHIQYTYHNMLHQIIIHASNNPCISSRFL